MITIITPSFNQGKYIERTIQSVLMQDVPHLEYVVIDGGSADETLTILKKYTRRLRFVSEGDRGQAHAVNKGLMMTSGDIIGWLNSDDIYYPNAIKTVTEFFAKNPDVDIIYGQANHINQHDQFIELYPTKTWDAEKLKQSCFISQPAVFFRRRVIMRHGLLNEKLHYCLDYEYWLRLASGGSKFYYLPHVLAGSRLYPETKTLSASDQAQIEAITMLKNRLGFVPSGWLVEYAVRVVKNKTRLKMPQWRFLFSTYAVAIIAAMRWNGIKKGLISPFILPVTMWDMNREKSRSK